MVIHAFYPAQTSVYLDRYEARNPLLPLHSTVMCNPKRRQCNNKINEKMNRQANASAKSKELQPSAQADTVAAHLLLPNRTLTNIDR